MRRLLQFTALGAAIWASIATSNGPGNFFGVELDLVSRNTAVYSLQVVDAPRGQEISVDLILTAFTESGAPDASGSASGVGDAGTETDGGLADAGATAAPRLLWALASEPPTPEGLQAALTQHFGTGSVIPGVGRVLDTRTVSREFSGNLTPQTLRFNGAPIFLVFVRQGEPGVRVQGNATVQGGLQTCGEGGTCAYFEDVTPAAP